MRSKTFGIIAFVAAVSAAGAASAADIYQPPPPIAPIYTPISAYNWTGLYVGIQGGYDWNHSRASNGDTANINGGIAGLYGGYNWQAPGSNWVFGIDASVNYDWASGPITGAPGYTGEVDWKGFVRGRVGYAWDRFLVYGTAGGAVANLKAVGPGAAGSPSKLGWTVGGGVEWAFAQNWTARLDYAYSNFGSYAYTAPVSYTATNQSHTVMLGVAYKF